MRIIKAQTRPDRHNQVSCILVGLNHVFFRLTSRCNVYRLWYQVGLNPTANVLCRVIAQTKECSDNIHIELHHCLGLFQRLRWPKLPGPLTPDSTEELIQRCLQNDIANTTWSKTINIDLVNSAILLKSSH